MKINIMKKMIEYFQTDVRRINHAIKVTNFAHIISEDHSLDKKTKEIITYAAILHDIGIKEADKKYNSSIGKYQEIEGPSIALEILSGLDISEDIINRVCFIIGNHHSYNKIDGIDFQIVVEADFLVNIYEEKLGKDAIKKINEHIFRTRSGNNLIKKMYLN